MLWLDIEGKLPLAPSFSDTSLNSLTKLPTGPQYWTPSQSANQAFFSGLVSAAQSHGISLGVYTSESQWIPIMGDWAGGASFPLYG